MFPRSRSTAFAMTSAARSTWSAVVNLPTVSRTVQMPTSSGTPMAFNTYDACSVPLPCRHRSVTQHRTAHRADTTQLCAKTTHSNRPVDEEYRGNLWQ